MIRTSHTQLPLSPITAEATYTGGVGEIFKLVGKHKPLAPQFPLAEPANL